MSAVFFMKAQSAFRIRNTYRRLSRRRRRAWSLTLPYLSRRHKKYESGRLPCGGRPDSYCWKKTGKQRPQRGGRRQRASACRARCGLPAKGGAENVALRTTAISVFRTIPLRLGLSAVFCSSVLFVKYQRHFIGNNFCFSRLTVTHFFVKTAIHLFL